jgi:hypothetical protein
VPLWDWRDHFLGYASGLAGRIINDFLVLHQCSAMQVLAMML